MASNANSGGIIEGYIVAGICIATGLTIASNWRNYSLKYFNFWPVNVGWRRHGFKAFRVVYGGFLILFGLTIFIIATVSLLNR
jgi:hypothetical protein